MQVTGQGLTDTSVEVIGPSLILDLSWSILKCQQRETPNEELDGLFKELANFEDRLADFWDDEMKGVAEAEVLAHLAGAIESTTFSDYRDRCERVLRSRTRSLDLRLLSESDQDEVDIVTRLKRLRKSRKLREKYFALLGDVWAVVSPWWETDGARLIESAVADVRKRLASGVQWYDINPRCEFFEARRPGVIERYEAGKPVQLVPCALFGQSLYFEFPDSILIGFGADSSANNAKSRVSNAIRPLRAIADPTRLAIFEYLKLGPSTVKEVSESFSLSQPTVSVHVKRLREVGLVKATRQGTQFAIEINWAEADTLSDALHDVLSR